jgi:uncharacterized membrane protein YagU involved in acid resistance
MAYGAAVSLVADEMAMPALGFTPPAPEVAASAHLRGFVSHLVFGLALEATRRLLFSSLGEQRLQSRRSAHTVAAKPFRKQKAATAEIAIPAE